MAECNHTPEFRSPQRFSLYFHVLRCVSIAPVRRLAIRRYRQHFLPDLFAFLRRCYQRAASLRARFPSSERYRAERRCCEKGGLLGLVPLLRAAL